MNTFPVQIELGNHVIGASVYALPRPGDNIECAFPGSGIPKMLLVVTGVYFHQTVEFEGKQCPEPFRIVVTTDGHPDHREHNDEIFKKLIPGKV
jgi:hypothetical protein